MKDFKSHFRFNKQERSGIFFLLLLIIVFQGIYFFIKLNPGKHEVAFDLNATDQEKIDSLKRLISSKESPEIFPFNPNYITDYKGYTLGMSLTEIDRLHEFRSKKQFVNSPKDFQLVTGVSDSLLKKISPFFKFPEWTQRSKKSNERSNSRQSQIAYSPKSNELNLAIKDINIVSADDMKQIRGIGEVLSVRIVKFRNRLGGFLVNEQLYDVYGLEPEVAERVLQRFQVINPPSIQKININAANVQELSSLIYISYELAQNIVRYRNTNGIFKDLDDLLNISGYPSNKNERIKLYLSL